MIRPNARALTFTMLVALASACGGEVPAPAPPPRTAATLTPPAKAAPAAKAEPRAPLDVDPVVLALGRSTKGPGTAADVALAREGITRLCDEKLAAAKATLAELRAMDGRPDAELTWDATLGKLDLARAALRDAADFPALMAVAHPDAKVRELAKACEPKVDELDTSLWLDATIARVVKRYAAKKEALPGPRARLLEHTLRDFRRNGLDLDAKGQARLRELNAELTKLGQDFDTNLASAHLGIDATKAELAGLPEEWLAAHPAGKDGKIHVSTDYPDIFPVLQYAKNRKVALELFKKFDNRAADKNVALLEKILVLRAEKAKLLGYATWADYVLEPRMAKDAKTVATFLDGLRKHIAKKVAKELAELRAMHVKLGGKKTDVIPPSDRKYLEDQVRKAKYGLDSKEVSEYFEVSNVRQGLLTITARMYGIRYVPSDAPTWHPDVEAFDVEDAATGNKLGRFYFDLYPREGKYKHAAMFSVRETMTLPNGERRMPIAAIECNFPKPSSDKGGAGAKGGGAPALMAHQEVVTFFHEFGHVLHHLLSQAKLASFAGTNVARDFVESPSQMFEEWAWNEDTLALFAKHYETGKPLPKKLHDKMLRSRSFGRAVDTQRQLFLAMLDQTYHTRKPPFDTTKVLVEVHDKYMPFKYIPGTHFQATFGHLIGYDAGYYGYQWALSIAQDLLTRFKKEGLLDTKTAAEYRKAILAPGGSDDEAKLVEHFLGRPPNDEAYKAFLIK